MTLRIPLYSQPIRLIPPGWTPPRWVEDKENNIYTPPGVRFFTVKEAVEVAMLCPAYFPSGESSELTAYFALTMLASSDSRMACIRDLSKDADGPIVAVGLLSVRNHLHYGRFPYIDVIVSPDHATREDDLRLSLSSFLRELVVCEEFPIANIRQV